MLHRLDVSMTMTFTIAAPSSPLAAPQAHCLGERLRPRLLVLGVPSKAAVSPGKAAFRVPSSTPIAAIRRATTAATPLRSRAGLLQRSPFEGRQIALPAGRRPTGRERRSVGQAGVNMSLPFSGLDLRRVVSLLGTFFALALFLSPVQTLRRIIRNKSTEDFSAFNYVATLLNCSIWTLYALPFITPDRFEPLVVNAVGTVLQLAYLSIFLTYAKGTKKETTGQQVGGVLAFMAGLAFVVMRLVGPEARSGVVGGLAVVFNIIMYGAPLSVMGQVIKTRSVEYMPLATSVFTFCCSVVWLIYSILSRDINILIPNAVGTILGVIQLLLYAVISGSQPKGGAKLAEA